jgi:hypothetical protein
MVGKLKKKSLFFTIQDDKNYQRSFATKMFASVFCLGANFLIFLNWKKKKKKNLLDAHQFGYMKFKKEDIIWLPLAEFLKLKIGNQSTFTNY